MPAKVNATNDSTLTHVYGHYVFEMELHPDDDPEGLKEDIRAMHFEQN